MLKPRIYRVCTRKVILQTISLAIYGFVDILYIPETGAGLPKCSSAMQRVADLSESMTGARSEAREYWDTGVVDCLLYTGVFPILPMATEDRDPLQSSGLKLV